MNTLDTRDLAIRLDELDSIKISLDELDSGLDELSNEIIEFTGSESDEDYIVLKEQLDDLNEERNSLQDDFSEDDEEELEDLKALERDVSEFHEGATLINVDNFTEYVEEMLDDCGDTANVPHYVVINWEATADNLAQDYSEVEYQGISYMVRS